MATEEVSEHVTKKRVEFWASSMDAFLQDFLAKAKLNDRLGAIIACARLSQLASAMQEEYEETCNALIDSPTEGRAANQAAEHVVKMIEDNGRKCAALSGETVPDTVPAPDRTAN